MHGLSIGKLAKSANFSIDTIRYYEKSGLLRPPARRPSGFREYSDLDLRKLKFIRRGRLLGFSLEEIAEFLSLESEEVGAKVNTSIQQKLRVIDWKIEQLQRWRRSLRTVAKQRAASLTTTQSILDCLVDDPIDAPSEASGVRRSRRP